MEQPHSFAAWLKQQRRALDFTQHTLAQHAGCTAETIRKIEAAKLRPSRSLAQRLVVALGIPLDAQSSFVALARAQRAEEMTDQTRLAPTSGTQRRALAAGLPLPRTSLVGRKTDVARLTTLLSDPSVRLVTLTGPPGVGKTRLAIEVATALATHFAAEVRFVALAALVQTNAVLPTIAQTLNLVSLAADDIEQALAAALRERPLVLVLDNMEHLRGAAHQLAQLLDGAPLLKLLVTSRTPLHLTGEHLWTVAPLAVRASTTEGTNPAVELFVQRARAVWQDYTLQDHTVASIATLCTRLDGLPLAIELAAARSAVLSPQALLRRFEEHLDLLTISPVDADTRHQTLRHAIAWSYALLDTDEQALLRCLSVFGGGCRLEMVRAVCATAIPSERVDIGTLVHQPPKSLLDRLTSLVDHSLVEQQSDPDGEPRFTLLATIHAFAREQALGAGEEALLGERHAYAYAALLEWVEPQLHGSAQHQWFTLLDYEIHNLRAALTWSQTEVANSTLGLRLATALTTFWEVRGLLHEGRLWLKRALAHGATAPAPLRALALARVSHLATAHGDVASAKADAEACLEMAGGIDQRTRAIALGSLGLVPHTEGSYECAEEYYTASLQMSREAGDHAQQVLMLERLGKLASQRGDRHTAKDWFECMRHLSEQHGNIRGVVQALTWQGCIAANEQQYERATALLHESLTQARALDYKRAVGIALLHLGELARLQGQYLQATAHYEESRSIWQEIGQRVQLAVAILNLGHVALHQEDTARALAAFGESMAICHQHNYHEGIALALAGCAGALRLRGEMTAATRLLAAATALRDSIGARFDATDQAAYERDLAAVRVSLDDAVFGAAWRAGQHVPFEQAVAEAQARIAGAEHDPTPTPRFPANLTTREVEVLQLLAHGLTNAEIAQRLVISPRTVNTHLNTIYRKLHVSSRSAATRFAVQHGLM